MEYNEITLKTEINIEKLMTLHYFEFAKDYVFEGERHDFWEFLYVDRGEVEVTSDTTGYVLKQGDIIFHKPDEFHSVWANKKIAPNIIVITFICKSPAMSYFKDKILNLADYERNLLALLLKEGFNAFLPPFNMPDINVLSRKNTSGFGCEQLIKLYLELLLINLIRKGQNSENYVRLSSTAKERSESDLAKRIMDFINENLCSNLTLDSICMYSKMSKSHLLALFKQKTGYGVMEYYKKQKNEYAKKLIREGDLNITQIADELGYSSIHSFTRQFKNDGGLSPTEYARSVQARL